MQAYRLIVKTRLPRRLSFDDYFLIDNQLSRCYNTNGGVSINMEFIGAGIQYLLGEEYELIRKVTRNKVWKEINSNKYKVEHFSFSPDSYHRVFNLIIKFYNRVKDSVINIEEIWSFLMEMTYNHEITGQLLFEQYHKSLFEQEILCNQQIKDFLNEIKNAFNSMQLRKKQKQAVSRNDSIVENLHQNLLYLEEDLAQQLMSNSQEEDEEVEDFGNSQNIQ